MGFRVIEIDTLSAGQRIAEGGRPTEVERAGSGSVCTGVASGTRGRGRGEAKPGFRSGSARRLRALRKLL
jgi:hypothetical protein